VTIKESDAQTVVVPALEACSGATCEAAPTGCSANETLTAGKCECNPTFSRNPQGQCVPAASGGAASGGGIPVLTWVFGGAGVASLAATGVFAVMATSKFSSSKQAGNNCDTVTQTCVTGSTGAQMQQDAKTFATVSTVTFIAGLALVGVGVGVWVFGGGSKSESAPKASLFIQPGGLSLVGRF